MPPSAALRGRFCFETCYFRGMQTFRPDDHHAACEVEALENTVVCRQFLLQIPQLCPVFKQIVVFLVEPEPTPTKTLHTILTCPPHQLVDVTALIEHMSEVRETNFAHGARYVSEVTIRDDSGPSGICQCSFTIWLPKQCESTEKLADLKQLCEEKKPVTFFALKCDIKENAIVIQPDFKRFRFAPCKAGSRAEQLESKANELLGDTQHAITVIAKLPVLEPRESTDYL